MPWLRGSLQIESGGMIAGGDSFWADWTEGLPEWENQLGPFDGKLNLEEEVLITGAGHGHPPLAILCI